MRFVIMVREKNNALAENKEALFQAFIQAWEQNWRADEEGHEHQAMKELWEWSRKWEHTAIAGAICGFMEGGERRRARGAVFDRIAIVLTVVLLEKIGMTEAAAKKQAAERFCTSLRNVQYHVAQLGAPCRQMVDFAIAEIAKRGAGWADPPYSFGPQLTQEEIRKLNEITFREK
jgi:hypothetical protein